MSTQREKRVIRPPTRLSPSDQFDRPTLYSSIYNISGNKATLNIHGKKTVATIITSGTLECCETKQRKITRNSQQDSVENTRFKTFNNGMIDGNDYLINVQEDDSVHDISSFNHQTILCDASRVNLQPNEEDVDFGDDRITRPTTTSKQKHQSSTNKTKRKQTVVNDSKPKRQRVDNTNSLYNQVQPNKQRICDSDLLIDNETNSNDSLNRIENQMILQQNMINKTLKRMERKFAFYCESNYIQSSKVLDQYRNENGENFPSEYMYGSRNLLHTPAKDIIDFARRTLKILFSQEELKTHILPPEREHFRRPSLDHERFNILIEAIRIKFRLDSVLMEQCFNDILRAKLSNFLYEERRRECRRRICCQERKSKQNMAQPVSDDNQETMDNQCADSIIVLLKKIIFTLLNCEALLVFLALVTSNLLTYSDFHYQIKCHFSKNFQYSHVPNEMFFIIKSFRLHLNEAIFFQQIPL
ncbi:hypothetical protein I4U23_000011 [Adineta vaga]|nr:hypothetical protein I4U23_000011 [Adineta vaga]